MMSKKRKKMRKISKEIVKVRVMRMQMQIITMMMRN
jgi:hypothetical protein